MEHNELILLGLEKGFEKTGPPKDIRSRKQPKNCPLFPERLVSVPYFFQNLD